MCNNISHFEMSKIGRFITRYRLQETELRNNSRLSTKTTALSDKI